MIHNMDKLQAFYAILMLCYLVKGECPWEGNTLCLDDSKDIITTGISDADKNVIVELHNEFRSKANPPAADLMVLTWDDKVAEVAQKLANQCKLYHDKDRRVFGYGVHIGQNVATGYSNWNKTISAWYSEKKKFTFGAQNAMHKVGHFTQILYEKTSRVGCGFAKCRKRKIYVCNYASGQLNYAFKHPYTQGERCGKCPKTCKNGLCDCKGKLCFNNGQIDPNECTCTCEKGFSGDNCENFNCPEKDLFMCPERWTVSFCKMYANVPVLCPHMCGRCP